MRGTCLPRFTSRFAFITIRPNVRIRSKAIQERAWVLYFASKVATLDANAPKAVSELLKIAQTQFAMDQGALIKFLASVGPAIREFAGLLRVEIGSVPNYASIITTGCQELIRLSVETSRASQSDVNLGLTPDIRAAAVGQ